MRQMARNAIGLGLGRPARSVHDVAGGLASLRGANEYSRRSRADCFTTMRPAHDTVGPHHLSLARALIRPVPMRSSLLAEARSHAADAGLNLFGLVEASRFDACQPKELRIGPVAPACGSVIVLGSGGRQLAEQFERARARSVTDMTPASFARAGAMRVAELLRASDIPCAFIDLERGSRLNRGSLAEAA